MDADRELINDPPEFTASEQRSLIPGDGLAPGRESAQSGNSALHKSESSTSIESLRLELELAGYRELWYAVLPLHEAAHALNAFELSFSGRKAGERKQDRAKRLKNIIALGDAVVPIAARLRPFLPVTICGCIAKLTAAVINSRDLVLYEIWRDDESHWREAVGRVRKLGELTELLSDNIRARIYT